MKKLFIILVTCYLLPVKCKAQTWVTIPDANFAHYLDSIIPSAMSSNQMNTSSTLVTTITKSIKIAGRGINNLSGIQYFTSLSYLDCSVNGLTNLSILPNSLDTLICNTNSALSSLPTLPNSLTYLNCDNNFLTSLPALPNSLIYLDCFANELGSLPALPNTLQTLYCNNNYLTSLPTIPNSLLTLYCGHNHLTALPNLPSSLLSLGCNSNNISCFPFFPNSMIYLYIQSNPYNCLPNYILPAMNSYTTTPLCAAGNTNGCAVAGIEQVAGINNQVTVYPNPANTSLILTLSQGEGTYSVSVYDMLGKLVMQHIYSPPSEGQGEALDISNISEGVYNLSVSTSEGIANKRVVIER